MEKKIKIKAINTPPLLCWDIYSMWLGKKLGITIESDDKPARRNKNR